MNFRFESKTLRMERPLGAATQQTAADASLELPAGLPDIARIVRVEAYPIVTDVDPLDNQVAVAGAIDVVLLYAHEEEVPVAASPIGDIEAEAAYGEAEGRDEDLPATEAREVLYRHRWRRAAPFEAAVEIPGVHPGAVVEVTAASAGVEAALRPDGRGIDVEAVVAVAARASEEQTATVPVPRGPWPAGAEALESPVSVEHVLGRGTAHVSVDGALAAPPEAPCARVVDVAAVARSSQAIAAAGEVTVAGVVDYRVLYVDQDGRLRTGAWQEQTPFAHTFPLPEAAEGAPVHVEARLTSVDGVPGEGGREIRVWADVEVAVRLARLEELALVESVAGPDDLDIRCRTEPVSLEEWVGGGTHPAAVTGALELPQGYPPIDRLLTAGAQARVADVLVLEDKVVVAGQADVDALYIGRSQGQPVYAVRWEDALPFECDVPLPGAEPGLEAQADVRVEDVVLDLLNRETAEAQVRLAVTVRLTRSAARDAVVEAVAVAPPDPDPPTWTFVVLQEGDTLWKLSHQYHTAVDRILAANPWLEDPEAPLPPGRKLCIPRRGSSLSH